MAYSPYPEPSASIDHLRTPPRISGTAMPHGVFLSTGAAGTASPLSLFTTGFTIVSLGLLSVAPTYILVWLAEQHLHLSLTAMLLQVGAPADPALAAIGRIGINITSLLVFLFLLRMTPLAGYHAAEHMTVHAIERYGVYGWEPHVADMPRAHTRCGSNLLSGILPAMIVGVPLFGVSPALSALVAFVGWRLRHRAGSFLQNTFTTKPPTPQQLEKGIAAGEELLAKWLADPEPRLSLAQRIWRRGIPPLIAGVILATYVFGALAERLHLWLDW